MKTDMQKMRNGELYHFDGEEMQASFARARRLCARLNDTNCTDKNHRELLEQLIPNLPKTADICPPFNCDHGHGIRMGEHSFMNYGCVVLDAAVVTLGRHVKLGPCCKLFTPQHPLDYIERRKPQEVARPITIGDDTWLGGNVTVCPGVTIGQRCIIAAGSVVIRDIPDDCLAAGNPAVVKRKLTNLPTATTTSAND
jgi:maltose O-acetyltransferase